MLFKGQGFCPYVNVIVTFKMLKTEFGYQEQFVSLDHLSLTLNDYIN